MLSYRDEIVVLRTQKLGEADRIVTMLGRRHGYIRAVAKGVRRTSSRIGARLEPFMVADVQLYRGRSLDTVQQAATVSPYGAQIVVDYERYTAASAMAETAERLSAVEASQQHYLLLVGGLRALTHAQHRPRSILDSYLLRAMAISGWAPGLDACALCGLPGPHEAFVAQAGGVLCPGCAPVGAAHLSPQTGSLLHALLTGRWDEIDTAGPQSSAEASGMVAAFAQWHLDRGIRSLAQLTSSQPQRRHA